MGWLFKPGSNRRNWIDELTTDWQRANGDGLTIKTTCLARCYRGNCFSGVLWAVWQRTFSRECHESEPRQRWITCDLLRYSRRDDGWGCKGMDESMHPFYYSCPKKYLDLVPIETYGGNPKWREQVQQYHKTALEKRQARQATRTT